MTIKVAINGYGRIGRNILRAHYEDGKARDVRVPRVGGHLLQAERHPLLFLIDVQDDARHLLALLHDFVRMRDLAGPAHVRNVQQAIDAVLDLDERAIVGEVPNHAGNDLARHVLLGHLIPRIGLCIASCPGRFPACPD